MKLKDFQFTDTTKLYIKSNNQGHILLSYYITNVLDGRRESLEKIKYNFREWFTILPSSEPIQNGDVIYYSEKWYSIAFDYNYYNEEDNLMSGELFFLTSEFLNHSYITRVYDYKYINSKVDVEKNFIILRPINTNNLISDIPTRKDDMDFDKELGKIYISENSFYVVSAITDKTKYTLYVLDTHTGNILEIINGSDNEVQPFITWKVENFSMANGKQYFIAKTINNISIGDVYPEDCYKDIVSIITEPFNTQANITLQLDAVNKYRAVSKRVTDGIKISCNIYDPDNIINNNHYKLGFLHSVKSREHKTSINPRKKFRLMFTTYNRVANDPTYYKNLLLNDILMYTQNSDNIYDDNGFIKSEYINNFDTKNYIPLIDYNLSMFNHYYDNKPLYRTPSNDLILKLALVKFDIKNNVPNLDGGNYKIIAISNPVTIRKRKDINSIHVKVG